MSVPCWDVMCAQDCLYCQYKQARYRMGFSKPCYEWFRERRIAKKCRECRYYLGLREKDPSLPEDPSFRRPVT